MIGKPILLCARLALLAFIGHSSLPQAGAATLSIHRLFTSHMVLQRDALDPVWGWDTPGAAITVQVYDQNAALVQTTTCIAGADGRWQAAIGPFGLVPATPAYRLTISDATTTVTLTDVLIGDVWLCSGQSNMAFSMYTIGVTNADQEIADAVNYPMLRCFTVPEVEALQPQTNLTGGSWVVVDPSNAGNITASGYFTAREIYKQQHIPIGIVCAAWGGTEIECWTELGVASSVSDFTWPTFDQSSQSSVRSVVSYLYNAMINPLAPFRIKAVEWYQGEYNTANPEQYSRMLPGLMGQWRALFGQPALPFIIIQLPNFGSPQTQPVETGSWAELREAQLKTALNDANSRIVTTIDIGAGLLHPTDKQDVGRRAAWAAADLVYGQTEVPPAPALAAVAISGTNLICTFNGVGAGLMVGTKDLFPLSPAQAVPGGTLTGFALCGANKTFYAANAKISAPNQVTVSSPGVPVPVAVRYGWGGYPVCNLYSQLTNTSGAVIDGLPASPFRTDPVNKLMVNLGTGTGYYASNATISIAASNFTGEVFDHWSGDTNLLSAVSNATVMATQAPEYVSVLANYRITGAPSGLAAGPSSSQVSLSWNPMSAVHYNLKRSTSSAGPYTTIAPNLLGTNNSYVDSSVTVGTSYYYVVSATNLMGEGPNSAPVTVTPIPGGPYVWTNTWDANGTNMPNPADGSGAWLTPTNWWNGSTNVGGNWNATTPNSAQFGAGTSGNYWVNLGGGTIYASNVVFATAGYTLTNGTLSLLGSANQLAVNANVSATLNSAVAIASFNVSSGATLTLGGGSGNCLSGTSSGPGTICLYAPAATTFTTSGNPILNVGTPDAGTGGLILSNNCALNESGSFLIGNAGASGMVTLNSPTAAFRATPNLGVIMIARNAGASKGKLLLINGTIDTTTSPTAAGIIVGHQLSSASAAASLEIRGGALRQNSVLSILQESTAASSSVTMSGGTATSKAINFGTSSSSGKAVFTMTGGTFYLGAGGLSNLGGGSFSCACILSGGIIGASAPWSSVMPLTLSNVNGSLTFQTADSNNAPQNITLAGSLSGIGGLLKSGGGILTLSGPNTYTGGTTITAGTLDLTTTNNAPMAYTNAGGILSIHLAAAGSSLPMQGLALQAGGSQLSFDLAGLGAGTAPVINNTGPLALSNTVTISVSNAPANAPCILLAYSGQRSGAGNFVAGQIPAGAEIVDDVLNKRLLLTYAPNHPPAITNARCGVSNFSFSGARGTPFGAYRVLSSTNLVAPLPTWVPVQTNYFDASGSFTDSIPFNPATASTFYRLAVP